VWTGHDVADLLLFQVACLIRSPCSVDAGRTASTRPVRCRGAAPGIRKARAPTKGLSTLNSMAFGLAVYASQCGLPTPHARLASSRWSDSTGRAFHPRGPDERFQGVNDIASSSPKLAWRNRIDRSIEQSACAPRSDLTEASWDQSASVCANRRAQSAPCWRTGARNATVSSDDKATRSPGDGEPWGGRSGRHGAVLADPS
jgi:hypothetical protein